MLGICKSVLSVISETLREFREVVLNNEEIKGQIAGLKKEVREFAGKFPMPGFEDH